MITKLIVTQLFVALLTLISANDEPDWLDDWTPPVEDSPSEPAPEFAPEHEYWEEDPNQ